MKRFLSLAIIGALTTTFATFPADAKIRKQKYKTVETLQTSDKKVVGIYICYNSKSKESASANAKKSHALFEQRYLAEFKDIQVRMKDYKKREASLTQKEIRTANGLRSNLLSKVSDDIELYNCSMNGVFGTK